MALSVDTTPAKHVTVLRNGDNKYEGRRFIVSRRRYRTFDSLLSDITNQISAPFGAVRRLYTPKGRRQIRGIEDIEGGATYVAGGSERFKKLDYSPLRLPGKNWSTLASGRPGFLADEPPPLVLPKKNKRYAQRSAQFYKVQQPVQFTVYRNGMPTDKGARFLLKDREMKSFETVLSIVSSKIRLVEGAVRRLYTPEGGSLVGPHEIVDGGVYVACGHRRFIPGPYGEAVMPVRTVQRHPHLHKMHIQNTLDDPLWQSSQSRSLRLPAIKRSKETVNQVSPRTQSNPLPAIQRKAMQTKARSEKDSPAPIEENKDEVSDEVSNENNNIIEENEISKMEIKTAKRSPKKIPKNSNSIQAVTEESRKLPSKSGLSRDPPSKTSTALSTATSPAAENPSTGDLSEKDVTYRESMNAPEEGSVFNAPTATDKPGPDDGKFLMNAVEESEVPQEEEEVEEDTDLVEDKPVELQQAEEVEEEERANEGDSKSI